MYCLYMAACHIRGWVTRRGGSKPFPRVWSRVWSGVGNRDIERHGVSPTPHCKKVLELGFVFLCGRPSFACTPESRGTSKLRGTAYERLAEYSWKPHRDSLAPKRPFMGLDLLVCAWETEGYGFIEFEVSNSTISTVFRQPRSLGSGGLEQGTAAERLERRLVKREVWGEE